jgi:hypothetical protein
VPKMRDTLQEIRISSTNKGERAYLLSSGPISILNEKELYNRDIGERNRNIRITRSALLVISSFINSIIASTITLSLKSGGHYFKLVELWNSV